MSRAPALAAALLLALSDATGLSAQAPAGDAGSVTLGVGVLAPRTTFRDPSFGESGFENGLAVGVSAVTWPLLDRRLGLRATLVRSETDGRNETSELAPLAVNDPNVYLFTAEVAARYPTAAGYPYLSAGYGVKHYTWAVSAHEASRFGAWTVAGGYVLRAAALGRFGVVAELRGYRSEFRAFGIDDGSWEPGPYGGEVGGVANLDLLLTTGLSVHF